jgi:hypothetical protein
MRSAPGASSEIEISALGGRSLAVSGWVLGAVAMASGSAVTLAWVVVVLVAFSQPTV